MKKGQTKMDDNALSLKELEQIKVDPAVRKALARQSHLWFFSIYMAEHITYPFAPLHYEMFRLTEDNSLPLLVLVAFRGSAKSTIMSLSYPIWAITGKQKKKFVLILTQTEAQAKLILANIRKELENNELLKKDIGPFQEMSDQWAATSIVLSNYNARITVASTEQSIRGIRHGAYRPDLIIGDDLEDLQSVKVKDNRDKVYQWFVGDVLPAGDKNTKIVVVGNLLHEDCLVRRMEVAIDEKRLAGIYKEIPLINKDGKIAWPGKYPTQEEVEQEKQKIGNEVVWQREYQLNIIPEDYQVVHRDWIHYYNELPEISYLDNDYRFSAIGVDLAISEKSTADYTAIIGARVFGSGDSLKIYIYFHIINKRLDFSQTLANIEALAAALSGNQTKIIIEDVAYQRVAVEQLKSAGFINAEAVPVGGQDKRARLTFTTDFIRTGKILFPKNGAGQLIQQLVNFGIERYDDLADAFSILITKIIDICSKEQHINFGIVEPDDAAKKTLPDFSKLQERPWKNEEERKKLEHEADLQTIKEQNEQRKNWS
jgi:phage terminase large subunit-like protein